MKQHLSSKQQKSPIGILGGMGAQATIDLYQKIINLTPAKVDQDHFHTIINSATKTPDRTAALIANGEDPMPDMIAGMKLLEQTGVKFAGIPCNTAHAFVPELQKHTDITLVNMIGETANYIAQNHPNVTKVGLLATTGTCNLGLYHKALAGHDIEALTPSQTDQESLVMEAIYGKKGIKAGYLDDLPKNQLITAANALINQGAEVIISGCTEIPLVLKDDDLSVPVVDPTTILALSLIKAVT